MSGPDDKLLEDFLAGEGEVARAYRAGQKPEAPAALDEAVLQLASRQALRSAGAWQRPIALAAVLVLGLSVLLNLETDEVARQAAYEMAPAEPASPSAAPAAPLMEAQTAQDAAPVAVAPPKKAESAPKRKALPPAPPVPQPAAAAAPPPEPAPVPTADMLQKDSGSAGALAPRMQRRESKAAAMQSFSAEAERPAPRPEDWLQRIRALRDAQKTDEARQQLREFRQAYPDQSIPDDLKALVDGPSGASETP